VQALVGGTETRLDVFGAVINVETLTGARLGILSLRLGVGGTRLDAIRIKETALCKGTRGVASRTHRGAAQRARLRPAPRAVTLHDVFQNVAIKGKLGQEAVRVRWGKLEHVGEHRLGDIGQRDLAIVDARGWLRGTIYHLRVEEAVRVALGWVLVGGTRWPPHPNVVDGALEVTKEGTPALWRRAAHKDLRQTRLEQHVFLEVERLELVPRTHVLAVDKEEGLRDNHCRIRASRRVLTRRPKRQGNVVPGAQERGVERPPRLDKLFAVAGREHKLDVIARISALHVPPQSWHSARVRVKENGFRLAHAHDEQPGINPQHIHHHDVVTPARQYDLEHIVFAIKLSHIVTRSKALLARCVHDPDLVAGHR